MDPNLEGECQDKPVRIMFICLGTTFRVSSRKWPPAGTFYEVMSEQRTICYCLLFYYSVRIVF